MVYSFAVCACFLGDVLQGLLATVVVVGLRREASRHLIKYGRMVCFREQKILVGFGKIV
jgi:hypothetical protein